MEKHIAWYFPFDIPGQKRAAVGYGPYRSGVIGNLGGNFGGNFGGRLGSRLGGWRNSGLNAFNGNMLWWSLLIYQHLYIIISKGVI